MRQQTKGNIKCREARQGFPALSGFSPAISDSKKSRKLDARKRAAIESHLETCARCSREYRLYGLQRMILDAACAPEPVAPTEDFFVALRARLARGPEQSAQSQTAIAFEDSWSAVVLMTARQLLPAMAVLLLLIIGATLLWQNVPASNKEIAVRPSERVIFNDVYDYPGPTPDDVLETLVAVEEKDNGK